MVHYVSVFIEFNTRFWQPDDEFIGHVNDTNGCYFPIFQVLSHIDNANILAVTVTDTLADRIIRQTEEQNKQMLLTMHTT